MKFLPGYSIKYDDGFWADIQNVIDWYDSISLQVCNKFLDQFWFTELRLKENPFAFRKVDKTGFRRIVLKQFPYKLYFRIDQTTIFVIALIHSSRSNRYIKKRLK